MQVAAACFFDMTTRKATKLRLDLHSTLAVLMAVVAGLRAGRVRLPFSEHAIDRALMRIAVANLRTLGNAWTLLATE